MTEKLRTHKDLTVWKKSIKLATSVYFEVKKLPQEELFGLTSQIKRSAVSIPSNVAEGFARNSSSFYTYHWVHFPSWKPNLSLQKI